MKRLWTGLCLLAVLTHGCAGGTDSNERASAPAPSSAAQVTGATPDSSDGEGADEGAPSGERAGDLAGLRPATTPTTPSASAPTPSSAAPGTGTPPPAVPGSARSPTPEGAGALPSDDAASGPSAGTPPPPTKPTGTGNVQAGTLTAGAWDDNLNFDRFKKYRADLLKQQHPGILPTTDEEHTKAREEFAQRSARETLDVLLMIDTTGSMSDEISYLQAEFVELSNAIEAKYPNAQQRWALILYRDKGDAYVTRVFDFRESATEFRDQLAQQSAGGGGDFPEAPDAAFEALKQLTWRSDDAAARLVFWVADAPHHDERAQALLDGIRGAKQLGVHVYPVASSGIDELTELTMRTAAQLTGGRYLFLTDDSGVGGAHKEPSIPCYFVTRLDHAILRMVDAELTGQHVEPVEDTIIRTSGEPKDGTCKLSSGETVSVF